MIIRCDLEEVEFAEEDDRKKADNEETDSEDPDHWWAAFPNWHPVGGEDIDEQTTVGEQPSHLMMLR